VNGEEVQVRGSGAIRQRSRDNRRRRRRVPALALAVAVAATLALGAAGCGSSGGSSGGASGGRVTLKVGTLQSLSLGDFMLAKEGGYFSRQGLDVQTEVIQNSQDAIVLLSQGRLDAVIGSISAGMLNSIAGGLDVRVVCGLSTIAPVPGTDEPPPSGVFVRKELADSGSLDTYAELKGRTVAAVGGMGTATSYLIGLYAAKGGLTLRDVKLKPFSIADALAALKSGAVDAAFLTAPFSQQAVKDGIGVELGDAREVYRDTTQSAVVFGPNLRSKNREAGVGFVRALSQAADAMQGDYRKKPEIVNALVKASGSSQALVTSTPPYFMTVKIDPQTLATMQTMFLGLGKILTYDKPLSYDQVVDRRFLADAGSG
jgi:NitT/TauT family transport system substrate-binding protein